MSGYVHIHAPQVTDRRIARGTCLDCKRQTRFLSFFQDWYGWHSTCIRCGRRWDDGEWLSLPFERNARRNSISAAKRRWRATVNVTGTNDRDSDGHPDKAKSTAAEIGAK